MKKLFFFALSLGVCASALHATELPVMTDAAVKAYQKCATTNKEITELLKEQDRIYKTLNPTWMYHNHNPFRLLRKVYVSKCIEKELTDLTTYLHKQPIANLKELLDIKDRLQKTVLRYETECMEAIEISRTHMQNYGKIQAAQIEKYEKASSKRTLAVARYENFEKEALQASQRYNETNKRLEYERTRYEKLAQYTTKAVIGIATIGVVGLGAYFAHDVLQKSNLSLNDVSTMATTGLNDFYTQCTRTLQQNWLFKKSASFFVLETVK